MTPPPRPAAFFGDWLDQALALRPTAHAMSLATATRAGEPRLRTVLLKAYGDDGFVFVTSPDTAKMRHITGNPHVALLFYWPESHRQVRIEGEASRLPVSALARTFFARGPRRERLTWISPEGRTSDLREALAAASRDICGVLVQPRSVRFWQGGDGQQHASLDYVRNDDGWHHQLNGAPDLLARLCP